MKATHRLLDSVWTLDYELVSDTQIKILHYDRNDPEGYERERELPQCRKEESNPGRIIVRVLIAPYEPFRGLGTDQPDGVWYDVVNPQFVFSYSD